MKPMRRWGKGERTYISGGCDDSRGWSWPRRRPHLLRMGIFLITDGLPVEFFVECILGWETGLDQAIPWVYVHVWIQLLGEKEVELISRRVGELSTKKLELITPTRTKILAYLLERRTQELNAILEGEDFADWGSGTSRFPDRWR